MEGIDNKDKKLLYLLSENSRLSDTQIAKKISLSKNAVKYRIERLQKLGVIKSFATITNLGALNLTTIDLLLKFNEDIYENSSIINYFKNNKSVLWCVSLSGEWDLFVEIATKDFIDMQNKLDNILDSFGSLLNSYKIYFSRDTLRVEHLVEDFHNVPIKPQKERAIQITKLDEVDEKILAILNNDSSLPYLKIASLINSTIDVVRYRIKSMIGSGVIVKFFADISLEKLGYTEYLCNLKLKNLSEKDKLHLRASIKSNPNITYAFFDIASLEIVFVCAFKDKNGIDQLMRSLRKNYSLVLESEHYYLIKEQILFNLFPSSIK